MLYQVTISTPDLDTFAKLAVLLRNNGFENEAPRPALASEIIEQPPVVAVKRAKKHAMETVAAIETPKSDVFDEAAYKAAGVAEATKELNRVAGRDAVIALLADFGQTSDAPSARGIAQKDWAAYVTQAKKRTASKSSVESLT